MLTAGLSDRIERKARELQCAMWDRQCSIWPGEKITHLDVCDPWVAAHYLGFEVQEGWLDGVGIRQGYQLGGFINRPAKLVAIADQQKPLTKRFTLAHELGHVVLHPGMHHHREIPIHGLGERSEPADLKEREANHFAGCFLVPAKPLTRAFRASFGLSSISLTDDVAYALLGEEYMSLMNSPPGSLVFERRIAQATRYKGRFFQSLHELFKVSPTTMAIRLRQSGLAQH